MSLVLAPALLERPASPRQQRRRLAALDRLAAHLTDLERIQAIVVRASAVVDVRWVQHAWFACGDAQGAGQVVTVDVRDLRAGQSVTGACLVGAIVQAGGGPAELRTQPVQRAMDLTWHALYGDRDEPVRWCPPPSVRAMHVRELTRWNDDQRRTVRDVTQLLASADRIAGAEIERTRRTRMAVAGAGVSVTP